MTEREPTQTKQGRVGTALNDERNPSLGRNDGALTRGEALAHTRLIVDSTNLPVSADLENGFGHEPEAVAETIRLAASAGAVGCSIEDATGMGYQCGPCVRFWSSGPLLSWEK